MTEAFERAEGPSAHHILRGIVPAPSRHDPHPFLPLIAYTASVCPVTPDLREPDEGLDAEDDRYAGMLWSACAIRDHLLSSTCDLAMARIQVATLSAAAAALAKRLDAEPMSILDVSAERAVTLTIRIAQIADVCLAECGEREALIRLAETAETCAALCASGYQPFATGARHVLATQEDLGEWRPGHPPLAVIGTAIQVGRNALARLEHETGRASERPERPTHAEEMDDDRAGIVRHMPSAPKPVPVKPVPASEPAPQGSGVVIFPASVLDAHATAEGKRDVKSALGAALDKPLALTPVPEDWNAWETARLAISPWGGDAFRAIREGQAGRTHVGRDVICFVGPAGAGKSHLVREAAESLGVPFARFGADSAAENSFAGTNARYTTKHPSFVEQAMARHRHAGPMILVEELEKAAGTRHSNGGRLHDCLHGMWEPETCGDWHSVFLLHPVSLAHVPFVCTANLLEGLPTSLLDRMKIVRVPEPGPEHLGVLAPRLARAVCRETGQDERFGDLDGDEISALADAWRGGSIRRLRRLVEICLRSRESGPAAMPRH
ncbi:hypothetical protein ASG52_11795 [Methylobacterium sp. Leaf456]|uniref:AAA family ATPase n=1 Tax=Methylobacterium sp. Leaf456 TaxID=1736382 RepID=UPI0006F9174D|nr:AAA family ATPase [Methylobacterium sp. Leaf456]KQT46417.1 hypothetical protein ASG52_11795 [Methylobacterium sp. Leaf456]